MSALEPGTCLRGKGATYHECIDACAACLIACEIVLTPVWTRRISR